MRPKNFNVFFLGIFLVFLANYSFPLEKQLIGARYPALSPDGQQVAFSYMGDLWLVSVKGGRALRLTDHVAYDQRPIWSPDGKWLAFTSNRRGNNDVYLMKTKGGGLRQLTFHTGEDVATDFTPDGKWIIFRSSRSSSSSLFKISLEGGNAFPVLNTYWNWPYQAKVSPDGQRLLFSLGMENGYWWRRGYQGSNTSKLWVKKIGENKVRILVNDRNNCFWPNWSPDGQRIYFVSDRKFKNSNIWTVSLEGSDLKQITQYKEKDVRWLAMAAKVPRAVYERDFGIWLIDLTTGESHRLQIEAPTESKENRTFYVKNAPVSEFLLSPDGQKIAAVVRGDIFVLSTDGGYARNITQSPWRERDIDWDKKSKKIVYVSDVEANPDLYLISALGKEKPLRLTRSEEDEIMPRFSPDGQWIAYFSGKRQLRLIKEDGSQDHLLLEDDFGGRFADEFSWSPDSRYLAVVSQHHTNQDIWAVNVESGQKILLTNTAYDESRPLWSPDGKFLIFTSNRYGHSFPEFTGKWDLYRVWLKPQKPEFDEDKFEKLFEIEKKEAEEKKKRKKPAVKIQFKLENLDRQTEQITNTLGNDGEYVFIPKDQTIYFVSNIDGRSHLWKTSLKKKKQGLFEAFMPGILNPSYLQSDQDFKFLYYLSQGKIGRLDLKAKSTKPISFKTKIQVDKTADYEQMLAELYYTLQHYYYDPNFHQVNWNKIYEEFRPVLQQVREDQDFYDYANEMIGYLNSSHTGIHGPRKTEIEEPSAHVGAIWEFINNKIILKRLIKDGPLYFYRDQVKAGDELIAVDDKHLQASQNIWRYFNGKLGKRLKLTFQDQKAEKKIDIFLKPISAREEKNLLLEEWIQSRKELVKKKANDQVAYIYMRAMGRRDLERFLKELEREAVTRKALILDLRFNFGGNVHDRVLQALTKPVYAKWRIRGLSETVQSTFGFTTKPVILVVNEVTLSDGEMTANGFKTLKRGPIVGNTTYGWLIFTTSVRLMNGGSFRLPFWGCFTLDGKDLETSGGVKPDVTVINDLNNELQNQDPQLEKAIELALNKVKSK